MTENDLSDIHVHGLSDAEVQRQLALLAAPARFVQLDRCCRLGDGVRVLSDAEKIECDAAFDAAQRAGRVLKFTPASGAASRMFKSLQSARTTAATLTRQEYAKAVENEDAARREVVAFMEGVRRFAFFDALAQAMAPAGLDAEALVRSGEFRAVVEYLITARGLDYANLPKGLLLFHRYPDGGRTAFEEQLVEAVAYTRDAGGVCRLHFTVSPQHLDGFHRCLERARALYGARFAATFEVGFSTQHPRTDTVAVDVEHELFRDPAGKILFRPGGHGALIENLNELAGDVVFIKNIDNVVPDHLKSPTLLWKRILGGYLVRTQESIFRHLAMLTQPSPASSVTDAAMAFAQAALGIAMPAHVAHAGDEVRREFLAAHLDRPLRICGVVRNSGEPGGGPFWVRAADGTTSAQIVESAEIDPGSTAQGAIFAAATHFNPVDLVCGVRDWRGAPFDLHRFVDRDAVFIVHKSNDGRDLKGLEHPGLWNGAMAGWNTIFVEVPSQTFNPVKVINDLLRPEHQPAS